MAQARRGARVSDRQDQGNRPSLWVVPRGKDGRDASSPSRHDRRFRPRHARLPRERFRARRAARHIARPRPAAAVRGPPASEDGDGGVRDRVALGRACGGDGHGAWWRGNGDGRGVGRADGRGSAHAREGCRDDRTCRDGVGCDPRRPARGGARHRLAARVRRASRRRRRRRLRRARLRTAGRELEGLRPARLPRSGGGGAEGAPRGERWRERWREPWREPWRKPWRKPGGEPTRKHGRNHGRNPRRHRVRRDAGERRDRSLAARSSGGAHRPPHRVDLVHRCVGRGGRGARAHRGRRPAPRHAADDRTRPRDRRAPRTGRAAAHRVGRPCATADHLERPRRDPGELRGHAALRAGGRGRPVAPLRGEHELGPLSRGGQRAPLPARGRGVADGGRP